MYMATSCIVVFEVVGRSTDCERSKQQPATTHTMRTHSKPQGPQNLWGYVTELHNAHWLHDDRLHRWIDWRPFWRPVVAFVVLVLALPENSCQYRVQ